MVVNKTWYDNISHKTVENNIRNKEFPFAYPSYITDYINSYIWRTWYIKNVGYCLISLSWIEPLSKWIGNCKVLEVMSGSGALSHALRTNGVNIISTDKFAWFDKSVDDLYWKGKYWCDIENIDAISAIEKYGKDVDYVLLSWAPINEVAYGILKKMREVNPNLKMIYIGETEGGATADDDFFEIAEVIIDNKFQIAVRDFQSFFGIYDKPMLFK